MANVPVAALPPWMQKLLRLIGKLIAAKAHGQVIVNIRDGKVQFFTVSQQYTPENLPDS